MRCREIFLSIFIVVFILGNQGSRGEDQSLKSETVMGKEVMFSVTKGVVEIDGRKYTVEIFECISPIPVHEYPMSEVSWDTPINAYLGQYSQLMTARDFSEYAEHFTARPYVAVGWSEDDALVTTRRMTKEEIQRVIGLIRYGPYALVVYSVEKGGEWQDRVANYVNKDGKWFREGRLSVVVSDPLLMQLSTDGWDFDAWKAQVKADKGE